MPLAARAPSKLSRCSAALCLALLFVCAPPLWAQAPSPPATAPATAAPAAPVPVLRAVVRLDTPWRFAIGDDPRWADPAYDDSAWPTIDISQPASAQGIDSYSGFAWYRMRLDPQQLASVAGASGGQPLVLLVSPNSVGQLAVYVNGIETGRTRGADTLTMYQSPAFLVPLPPGPNAPLLIAIRSWAGPRVTIHRGLLERVELGSANDLADHLQMARAVQWDERVASSLFLTLAFLCVALLGAALYVAQRNHTEYLWLAILCVSAAAGRTARALEGLTLVSEAAYGIVSMFAGYVFMAVTIEFVLRFTGTQARRSVRAIQIGALIVPFLELAHMGPLNEALPVAAEAAFCIVVTALLFRAWRRGQKDAGVMFLPFFLAAASDWINTVLSFLVGLHWLPPQFDSPSFHFGPITFGIGLITDLIFLFSIIAVILYRFIMVSQDEQRSNAEVAAARSVQSLLIPTQLPSTRNFMLESAYLPVNGVGGDFFQVLPLHDESLLIVFGDVSGKGLQAAMNSSTLVGALRNELAHDPATVLTHLNRVLIGAVSAPGKVPDLDAAPCFATCLCARIYADGTLVVANAGHLGPYRDGRELELPSSLPLGVIAGAEYEQVTFHLDQGDRLVLLSDGVVEATNSEGELFGFERTQQVSNESARYIAQTARHFGQTDDITVMSLYVASRTRQKTAEVVHSH
ncbi:MAG TPA: SpoIIE family protein phosphatase [Terracidiphilus sp.]|nr:SpoIIE family protein phosphatase [Terracidiphilus sp.]